MDAVNLLRLKTDCFSVSRIQTEEKNRRSLERMAVVPNFEDKKFKSKQCKVCGDMAKYAYFGVISCHPCKMFFKRYAETKQVRLQDSDDHELIRVLRLFRRVFHVSLVADVKSPSELGIFVPRVV